MDERGGRPGGSGPLQASRGPGAVGERIVGGVFALCAGLTALVMLGIILVFITEAVGFFTQVSILEFLTETRWTPLFQEKHFGILPLLSGSILVAVGAGLVALPGGLLTAIFLSGHAGSRVRSILKPLLEVLAGIPTVVYGYFALTFVTPLLQGILPRLEAFNAASAAVVVGIMILPTVASLSDDALRAVPNTMREAALGLGAAPVDVTIRVVIPAGASGILASFILGLSRAFGETMVVAMAAGNSPHLTLNPLESIQTMSAYVLQAGQGNIGLGTMDYRTLFAVGMMLFLITMIMNHVSQWVRVRLGGIR